MRKYISLILIIAVVFTITVPLMANTTVATVTLEEQALVDINGGDRAACFATGVFIMGGFFAGPHWFVAAAAAATGCF